MTDNLRVVIRMYRGLLGDCFLIRTFEGQKQSSILIDCGVLQGSENAAEVMQTIAADIKTASNGRLDLVVATHEHADHLSGFAHARELFFEGGIDIGALWLAWTEDPADKQARLLDARFNKRRETVQRLAIAIEARAEGSPFALAPRRAINGLEAFIGAAARSEHEAAGEQRLTIGETLDKLRDVAGLTNVSYLEPGAVLQTPGQPSLKAFVFAPPRDEKLLLKDLPSKGANHETYVTSVDFNSDLLMAAAGLSASDEPNATADRTTHSPFARADRLIRDTDVREQPSKPKASSSSTADDELTRACSWLHKHYYEEPKRDPAAAALQRRRRIDGDWLTAAGEFALKLDSDTNNTSLVLAFQLPDDSFLLFAADAQVGNWQSWHSQTYADGERTLTATDILNRVRFYKVGHHGSHNATLDREGLSLMTRPDLVAMVSTDEDFALKQGQCGWLMPNPRVKKALLDRTQGRLIRGDRRWAAPRGGEKGRWPVDPDVAGYSQSADFVARLDESNDLYVDYTIFGEVERN